MLGPLVFMKKLLKLCRMLYLQRVVGSVKCFGNGSYVAARTTIKHGALSLGRGVFLGNEAWVSVPVYLDDFCMVAARVAFVGGDHIVDRVDLPMRFAGRGKVRPIYVGKDVWIGFGAIILHGVTIGPGAIVGAGAVVTKDVKACTIVGGVPARFIRSRFNETDEEKYIDTSANWRSS